MASNRFEIDMCTGSIMPKLISFCLPLMLSSMLQLLFNAVDLVVVGRFAGSDSLAAVGATAALIGIFVNFFIGISMGANVIAARCYAQGDYSSMSKAVHTAMLTALISGIAMSMIGQIFARPALELMGTPAGVIDRSALYMRIYFIGTPFFMLYNFGAAVLRAVGDTKRPMLFLFIAGAINAGLNLLLVIVFKLDVAGVAVATAFSQMISCALVLAVLFRAPEGYRLRIKELRIDKNLLIKIVRIGFPAGVQSVVINASNAMLQSSVNSLGRDAMAGYTSANNLFGFIFTAANSVSQGCMSFTSQNYGAHKFDRLTKVLVNSLILETCVCLTFGSVLYFLGPQLLSIYSTSPKVIENGLKVLSLTTLTYFLCGYMDCIPGALRGLGHSLVPMILSITGTVGTRIIWIYGFFPTHRDLRLLFICYPLSWSVTVLMQAVCYGIIRRKINKEEAASALGGRR